MNGKTLEDYESELWEDPRALLDLLAEEDPEVFSEIERFIKRWANVRFNVRSKSYGN